MPETITWGRACAARGPNSRKFPVDRHDGSSARGGTACLVHEASLGWHSRSNQKQLRVAVDSGVSSHPLR